MASLIRSTTFTAAVLLLAQPAAWPQQKGKPARGTDRPADRREGAEVHPHRPGGQGSLAGRVAQEG